MAIALAGAISCGRCGAVDQSGDGRQTAPCRQCDRRWAPAALGSAVGLDAGSVGPLAGVVRAGVGRRYLAHLLDAVPVLLAAVVVAGGVVGAVVVASPVRVPFGVAAATVAALLVVLAGQLALYVRAGRSLGRLALGLRTVDDLTGTPVGARVLGRLRPGRGARTVTAALRHGRDPLDQPPTPALVEPTELTARHRADTVATAPAPSAPRPSVAIVLASGERYEIWHALLLGRSPVDPDGGRALLAWPDLSRRLAKTHVLLEWSGTTLWVTDLATASGTALVSPAGDRTPLVPRVRTAAAVGWTVECGGRAFTVRPGGTAVPAGGRS